MQNLFQLQRFRQNSRDCIEPSKPFFRCTHLLGYFLLLFIQTRILYSNANLIAYGSEQFYFILTKPPGTVHGRTKSTHNLSFGFKGNYKLGLYPFPDHCRLGNARILRYILHKQRLPRLRYPAIKALPKLNPAYTLDKS